jgi:hypothetical protein
MASEIRRPEWPKGLEAQCEEIYLRTTHDEAMKKGVRMLGKLLSEKSQRIADLERQLADVQRAKYGTPCCCESWISTCREAEDRVTQLEQENAELRAENERLKTPVSDEEWIASWRTQISSTLVEGMCRTSVDALIAARAGGK